MGKLPASQLQKLLSYIPKDHRMLIPPRLGMDSGVHRLDDDRLLVVSTDPCIGGPPDWFGWFLIHYVASDIALFGAQMEFCTVNLLGSPDTEAKVFHRVIRQASQTAQELGAAVVTGHTGTYHGLSTLLGVCTGYGQISGEEILTPGDAQPGDRVVCVKPVGLETIVNMALTNTPWAEELFGKERTRELQGMVTMQSCVKEAALLAEMEGVHGMHDATEGGVTAALNEVAEASHLGFQIEWEKLPFPEEMHRLREKYQLSWEQLLSMSSTGTVLAAVSPEAEKKVEEVLRRNQVEAQVVGTFTKHLDCTLIRNREEIPFPREPCDPYSTLMDSKP